MAVYVDESIWPYGRMMMCHMMADTLEELHAMARQLGMRGEWFQARSHPHYDLCKTKRAKAVSLGAIEIDRHQTVALIRKSREHASPQTPTP